MKPTLFATSRYLITLAALLLHATHPAFAHDPGMSSATVFLGEAGANARVVVAVRDLVAVGSFDRDRDLRLSTSEIEAAAPELEALAAGSLELSIAGIRATPVVVDISSADAGEEVVMRVEYRLPQEVRTTSPGAISIRSPLVERLPHGHRQFVRLIDADGTVASSQLLHRDSGAIALAVVP